VHKPKLSDYFPSSKKERMGGIILLFLLIIITQATWLCNDRYRKAETIIVTELDSIEYEITDSLNDLFTKMGLPKDIPLNHIEINSADTTALMQLPGIGSKLSRRIVNFRNYKGGFTNLDELKEVYGLSEEVYNDIKKHLRIDPIQTKNIATKQSSDSKKPYSLKSTSKYIIDINKADSATLTLLHGIGPVLAGRIVKYRGAISGFDSTAHIISVYGVEPEWYQKHKSQLTISEYIRQVSTSFSNSINKTLDNGPKVSNSDTTQVSSQEVEIQSKYNFDLNTVSAEELLQIRGIGPFFSTKIIELRQQLGGYAQMDQLKNIYRVDSTVYAILTENLSIQSPHQKFSIDTISFQNLNRMKILDYNEVKYIFNLKRQKGNISNMKELENLQGIKKDHLILLEKYLTFPVNSE